MTRHGKRSASYWRRQIATGRAAADDPRALAAIARLDARQAAAAEPPQRPAAALVVPPRPVSRPRVR